MLATVTHALSSVGADASEDGTGRGTPLTVIQGGSQQDRFCADLAPTLAHASNTHQGHHQPKVTVAAGVRRLTPTECERLQALPDGWTAPDGVKCPDSRRYAALGDAVTASVAQWIGERILAHLDQNGGI